MSFGQEYWNHGNGYNMSTGLFTAPYPGLYTFIAQICHNEFTVITIRNNGNQTAHALIYASNIRNCASTTCVIELDTGDEVGVYISTHDYVPMNYDNQFTGYLIHRYP